MDEKFDESNFPETDAQQPPVNPPAPAEAAQEESGYGYYNPYAAPPTVTQAQGPHVYASPAPPKKRKTALVIFSVLALLVLVLGATVAFNVLDKNNDFFGLGSGTAEGGDDSRLTTVKTVQMASESGAVGAMASKDVYTKVKNSNVAVLVYTNRTDAAAGEGSGVIIQEDSAGQYTYIVTCAHVISGNARVSVELEDGTTYDAVVVGMDDRTDVGVLKIKATGLEGATFGDSGALVVGDPIYALGNPGGTEFKGSFTNGMISAIDRPLGSAYKMKTIQHTAPINPGNSGGALINALGQVVGVNSQKIVDTEYEGMGFAIPSEIVQEVVNNLIAQGYVPNRPKLGIQYLPATQSQAGYYAVRINNLPSGSLIIARIDDDSVLKGTKVQEGDVITHVNGDPLNKSDVLLQAIENGKVGDSLELKIARISSGNYEAETFTVNVVLIEDKGAGQTTTTQLNPWYEGNPFGAFGF